ncbi:hypothetical protein BH11ARM2_BH11ARM2_39630 [soil metagenome]
MFAGVGGRAVGAIKSAPKTLVSGFAHVAPTEAHHPIPKFLGGFEEHYLYHVNKDFHTAYHVGLHYALLDEFGYPALGPHAKALSWHTRIANHQTPWSRVVRVIQALNKDFDDANGTMFGIYFEMMMRTKSHRWP